MLQLLWSLLPSEKHAPISPRTLVTPTESFLPDLWLASHDHLKLDTMRPDLCIAKEATAVH